MDTTEIPRSIVGSRVRASRAGMRAVQTDLYYSWRPDQGWKTRAAARAAGHR